MIDIHTHIIPEVDDGSASIETSMEMLGIAEDDGIEAIVATPHTFSHSSVHKEPGPLREKFLKLKAAAAEKGLKIEILQGAENFFHSRLRDYLQESPELLTINNSDYFLLEFPVDFVFPGTRQFIYNVMSDGYIPIIAHPERNRQLRKDPALIYEFLQIGALSQVTAGSIRGDFGHDVRAAAMDLLRCNMVNVIASDSHNTRFRRPEMGFVYEELKEMDRKYIDVLTHTAPRAIVDNEAVPDTGSIVDPTRNSSVFDFIKGMFK